MSPFIRLNFRHWVTTFGQILISLHIRISFSRVNLSCDPWEHSAKCTVRSQYPDTTTYSPAKTRCFWRMINIFDSLPFPDVTICLVDQPGHVFRNVLSEWSFLRENIWLFIVVNVCQHGTVIAWCRMGYSRHWGVNNISTKFCHWL